MSCDANKVMANCEMHILALIDEGEQEKIGIDCAYGRTVDHKVMRLCSAYNELLAERDRLLEQNRGYGELLAPANHDVEQMDKYAKDLEQDNARLRGALEDFRARWDKYKEFLQKKYPAPEGEEWKFTCPHHQGIEHALKEQP